MTLVIPIPTEVEVGSPVVGLNVGDWDGDGVGTKDSEGIPDGCIDGVTERCDSRILQPSQTKRK